MSGNKQEVEVFKFGVPFLGVLATRMIVHLGLVWKPPSLKNMGSSAAALTHWHFSSLFVLASDLQTHTLLWSDPGAPSTYIVHTLGPKAYLNRIYFGLSRSPEERFLN